MARTRFGSLDGIHEIKKNSIMGTMGISVCLFTVIMVVFLQVVSIASAQSKEEQRNNLSTAIDRAMLQCYVTEGRYPDNFEYLADNYGIIYDQESFRVDMISFASNMKPEVTIVELEGEN